MKHRRTLMVFLLAVSGSAMSYEPADHQLMTEVALEQTEAYKDDAERKRIGIRKPLSDRTVQLFSNSKGKQRSIIDLMRDGAQFEDEKPRSLNHFFNPITNSPLNIAQSPRYPVDWTVDAISLVNNYAQTSPEWSLEKSPSNRFTYASLKDYHFQALTSTSNQTRADSAGLMFETLGRMVHHIQDMAQPQHVRNDMHLQDDAVDGDCASRSPSWYCAAYQRFRTPSSYEAWTRELQGNLPFLGYGQVYGPGAADTTLATPRKFWTNGGKGIADYTNRNFVSVGTTLIARPVLYGDYDVLASDLCAGAFPACEVDDLDHVVTFRRSLVDDQLRPELSTNMRASAASIYEWDFRKYAPAGQRPFTVNRFTFKQNHDYLLPRAVGYSAGLINYYFRGDMEFQLPDDGVFAVVDTHPQACGVPCGFRLAKLKIRNTTPNDAMGVGQIWLVAKYQLNDCYKPDLSGEDGGSNFAGNVCQTRQDYVAVSGPIDVRSIPRTFQETTEFPFPGPNPIPINATDLSLQVVFRGELGQEPDAIAVSTLDVTEPNFVAIGNITDYAFSDLGSQRYYPLPATVSPVTISKVTFTFQDPLLGAVPLATLSDLNGGEHAQFAFITDRTAPPKYWLRSQSPEPYPQEDNVPFPIEEFFLDETSGTYARTCQVTLERGQYRQFFRYFVEIAHSILNQRTHVVGRGPQEQSAGEPAVKYASNCYGAPTPGSGGLYDFSYLLPAFGPTNAKPWAIQF